VADYATVAGFLLQFLRRLQPAPPTTVVSTDDEGRKVDDDGEDDRMDVVFAGYSYGSLITTRLPDPTALLAPFSTLAPGREAREVATRARLFAEDANRGALRPPSRASGRRRSHHQRGKRSVDSTAAGTADDAGGGAGGGAAAAAGAAEAAHVGDAQRRTEPKGEPASTPSDRPAPAAPPPNAAPPLPASISPHTVAAHYLLVSPILPPISTLTALPPLLDASDAGDEAAHLQKFRDRPALAVFGDRDVFTSARRLTAWCEERGRTNARFDWREVPGAGHFWHERGAMGEATLRIKEWIGRIVGE
jgi:hypothetical protein